MLDMCSLDVGSNKEQMDQNIIACAQIVEKGDPVRFRAIMALPAQYRPSLFVIFAFNLETARAPWMSQETMIAEMRLQWWHDALEEIATGGTVRRHEVVSPLAKLLTPDSARTLQRLVAARRWDIYKDPFASHSEFETYLESTSSSLLLVAARVLGACEEEVVYNFGYASGLARFFLATPKLYSAGRQPILDRSENALRAQAQEGLDRLFKARKARKKVSKEAGYAFLGGWQSGAILKTAVRSPEKILTGGLLRGNGSHSLALVLRRLTGLW